MLKYSEAIYQGKIDQLTEYISMLNGHVEKLSSSKISGMIQKVKL